MQKEIEDEELKRVYKKLALLLHPDKVRARLPLILGASLPNLRLVRPSTQVRLTNESDRPRAEQAFRGVQVAYETLKVGKNPEEKNARENGPCVWS